MGAKLSSFADSVAKKVRRSPTSPTVDARDLEEDSTPKTEPENIETGHDPAVHGAKLEDRNYNNEAFKKRPADPQETQQKSAAATTIQTQFRQAASKEEAQALKEEDAAIRIQAGFRGYMGREHLREMKEGTEQDQTPWQTIGDYSSPEVDQAAVKIQAGFRGYRARQELQAGQENTLPEIETPTEQQADIETPTEIQTDKVSSNPDYNQAATKIQAGFRGHIARRHVKELKKHGEEEEKVEIEALSVLKPATEPNVSEVQTPEEEKENNPLHDVLAESEAAKAATRIQASYRGYRTRKSLHHDSEKSKETLMEEDHQTAKDSPTEDVDHEEVDAEREQAVTKIQAGYRGYSARKGLADQGAELGAEVISSEVAQSSRKPFKGIEPHESEIEEFERFSTQSEDLLSKLRGSSEGIEPEQSQIEEDGGLKSSEDFAHPDSEDGERFQEKHQEPVRSQEQLDKEKAARRIQAGFRGMKARNEIRAIRQSRESLNELSEKDQKTDDEQHEIEDHERKEDETVEEVEEVRKISHGDVGEAEEEDQQVETVPETEDEPQQEDDKQEQGVDVKEADKLEVEEEEEEAGHLFEDEVDEM